MPIKPIRLPRFGRPLLKPSSVKLPKFRKTAGVAESLTSPSAVGAAIGAGVMVGIQALSNIKGKDGVSAQQRTMRARERHFKADFEAKQREGKPLSFSDEVHKITAKPYSQLADLATKHPVRSALRMGMTGAAGGAAIARLLTKRAAGPALQNPPKPQMPKMPGAGGKMPGMPQMPTLPGMPKMAQERLALADAWGRELAKEAFAGNQMVGQAMKGIMRSRWGGAGAGAAMGAARYATSNDPNKSFVGSVGGGAMAGGMAHQLAKGGIGMAAKNKGDVGKFVRSSNQMANKAARAPKATPIKPTPPASPAPAGQPAGPAKPGPAKVQPASPEPTSAQREQRAREKAGPAPAAAPPPVVPPVPSGPVRPPGQPPPMAQAAVSPAAPPIAQPMPFRNPQVPPGTRPAQAMKTAAMQKIAARRLDLMRSRTLSRMMGDM